MSNPSCSDCQQDVRKIEQQTDRHIERPFSLVIKTKLDQNVNKMSERHAKRHSDRQTYGQTDRKTDRRQNDFSA